MFIKIYDKVRQIIKDNLIFIIIFVLLIFLFNFELPYYIKAPGTLINVEEKIDITYESSGSYNMTYVTEYKPNIFNYILAHFIPNWDIESKEDVILPNETDEDTLERGHILLEAGNQIAIINAFKMANKEITINDSDIYVTYIDELAKTNLKIGDKILKIDGKDVESLDDISRIINDKDYDDKVLIATENSIKEAIILNYEETKKIGISLSIIYDLASDINFRFKNNESGSSGGLMTTLYIYDYLIEEDLTKGRKIAGTGTIESDGSIGEIGGVKYKLIGAVKGKADIFLVPKGNYAEALAVKSEKNYDIEIISVDTLKDAIEYLEKT